MRPAFALALAGCFASPRYDGTMYQCMQHPDCPAGFTCDMQSGYCTQGSGSDGGGPSDLVPIPMGPFQMGCNTTIDTDCPTNAMPYHTVMLSAFVIMDHEVTQAEYALCTSCPTLDTSPYVGPNLPIGGVTHDAATKYCASRGLLLPTEAQWERAARGTDDNPYPWDNNGALDCSHANYAECHGAPIDESMLSPGDTTNTKLRDMAGNVAEWVSDQWDASGYTYPGYDQPDPTDTTSGTSAYVIRGGSFHDPMNTAPSPFKVWNRTSDDPNHQTDWWVGFRCARIGS
jgi:formylglycine-generating enzyme required for sulfatase activity